MLKEGVVAEQHLIYNSITKYNENGEISKE